MPQAWQFLDANKSLEGDKNDLKNIIGRVGENGKQTGIFSQYLGWVMANI